MAITFYPLLMLTETGVIPLGCFLGYVLWVVSGAALVAGLPEAIAAGRWARLVYYAALLFWPFLVVAPLVVAPLS